MKFTELALHGAYVIELEPIEDERGFFARSFCKKEFAAHNLCTEFVQCNVSYNKKRGTLRGMHYQCAPYGEVKVVSCIAGAIYDVIIDSREDSATKNQWVAVELSAENRKMLYIPEGFAHGFQTLEDNSTVYYQMGNFYVPDSARGIAWDDAKYGIKWPIGNPIMSYKDKHYGVGK